MVGGPFGLVSVSTLRGVSYTVIALRVRNDHPYICDVGNTFGQTTKESSDSYPNATLDIVEVRIHIRCPYVWSLCFSRSMLSQMTS